MNKQPQTDTPGGARYSVVTPSYNQARFLRENIESVRAQNVEGVEHIVADGGSTDGSVDILKEYPDARWVSEPDRGQSDALNKAIAMARGEWIVWINSDDTLLPGALRALDAFLEAHPDAQFVYSNCVFTDAEGNEIRRRRATYHENPRMFETWWRAGGYGFDQPGTFFRRALWERYGPFDPDLHYTMDHDFWLRIRDHVEFEHLDAYTATYRLHEASKTGGGRLAFARENVLTTRRYWDRRGGMRKWAMRLRLRNMLALELGAEARNRLRSGEFAAAARFLAEAFLQNPLWCLSPSLWLPTRRRNA